MLLNKKKNINKIIKNTFSNAKKAFIALFHTVSNKKAAKKFAELPTCLRKTIVYTLAIAIVTVLGFGTFSSFDLCFGSEAIVNGKVVALVDDQKDFEKTLSEAKQFMSAVSDQPVELKVTYVPRIMSKKDITSEDEIRNSLYAQCNSMVKGYGIYVDGQLVAAALYKDVADGALYTLKDKYEDSTIENLTVTFDKDVEIKEGYVPSQMIMSSRAIAEALTGERKHFGYYAVEATDTVSSIAKKLNVSVESLNYLNNETLYEGKIISYQHKDTLLKVKTEYTQKATAVIPYETERISDSSIKKGNSKVKTKGSDGEKIVTTKIVMINGEEVSRTVADEQILTSATNEVILIGSNTNSGREIVASAEGSTGYFLWPNRGQVSSRFGMRSRDNHKGIDICSPVGTDIYAADGGVVTFAGWNDGGYGYMVIIDHGNGYVTYYAHCNEVLVNEGDKVSQGDLIALVGNTGLSTGPHLHFEVRLNGTPVNPLNYMDE